MWWIRSRKPSRLSLDIPIPSRLTRFLSPGYITTRSPCRWGDSKASRPHAQPSVDGFGHPVGCASGIAEIRIHLDRLTMEAESSWWFDHSYSTSLENEHSALRRAQCECHLPPLMAWVSREFTKRIMGACSDRREGPHPTADHLRHSPFFFDFVDHAPRFDLQHRRLRW